VPYRVDFPRREDHILDLLVALGALDVECDQAGMAALMPDSAAPEQIARALGIDAISVSPAVARDDGSVWRLGPRSLRIGHLQIIPARGAPESGALRLIDGAAFGTGLHPTTALCLESLQDVIPNLRPHALLDVGTGSGILALAGLMMGVPRALGIDIDDGALRVAAENARINALEARLELVHGGPDIVPGMWPLVVANVLAAPLIQMAPALVRRVGRSGHLLLSGIPAAVERDVDRVYKRAGMRRVCERSRAGWVTLEFQATW
jgi:ribosomal protein L11 methyltransferase